MALLDEAIENQRTQFPGGPGPALPPPIELARRGRRGRGGHRSEPTLEIPQLPPGMGAVAGPPSSAAAPREEGMPDVQRALYDLLYRPSNYLFGGKSGPRVAEVLGALVPIIAAIATLKYGLGHVDRPFNPEEFGIPELERLPEPGGRTGPIYRPRLPPQQAPGRTVPLGPGRTTGELEFEPFLHPWEEEEEEPPGGGWKH